MKLPIFASFLPCCSALAQCDPAWSRVGPGSALPVKAVTAHGGVLYFSVGPAVPSQSAPSSIARWDGSAWSTLPATAMYNVASLTSFGSMLAAGGDVTSPFQARSVQFWDGISWSYPTPSVVDAGLNSIAAFHGNQGLELVASGGFDSQGLSYIARWNGASWLPAASGLTSIAYAMLEFDDGTGPSLYATGILGLQNNSSSLRIARWNGQAWFPLGGGLTHVGRALAIFDGDGGPALYVGGSFTNANTNGGGGILVNHVARWDGQTWSALGSGVDGDVFAMAVFNDGNGPALYVGGAFTHAGGQPANHIARWRKGVWSPVGSGIDGVPAAMTIFDPLGPASASLIVTGTFTSAGGVPVSNIAAWGRGFSPNCDESGTSPVLNANDFLCFLNKYAAQDPYANCDGSTTAPILSANDFQCFLNKYGAGCV